MKLNLVKKWLCDWYHPGAIMFMVIGTATVARPVVAKATVLCYNKNLRPGLQQNT